MFIGDPPGNTDRILEFSTAVTGALFFVPAADFLDDLPGPPAAAGAAAAPRRRTCPRHPTSGPTVPWESAA